MRISHYTQSTSHTALHTQKFMYTYIQRQTNTKVLPYRRTGIQTLRQIYGHRNMQTKMHSSIQASVHPCISACMHPSFHPSMTCRTWRYVDWHCVGLNYDQIATWFIYTYTPDHYFRRWPIGGWDRDDNVPWTCTHPRCYAIRPNRKNPFLAAADIIPKDALVPGSLSWLEWQQNVSATLEEGSQDFLAALGDVGLSFFGVQGQGIARWRTAIV